RPGGNGQGGAVPGGAATGDRLDSMGAFRVGVAPGLALDVVRRLSAADDCGSLLGRFAFRLRGALAASGAVRAALGAGRGALACRSVDQSARFVPSGPGTGRRDAAGPVV